jgi:hypothetical protein
MNADNAIVTGSTFSGNTAGTNGGGITASPGDLTDSTVTGNTAGLGGGGFRGNGSLTESTVRRNEAGTDGGGTSTDFNVNLTVSRSTIAGNDAVNGGGGIFFSSSGILGITNSTLSGNSANTLGGGILTNEGTVNLRNATINRNVVDVDSTGVGSAGGISRDPGSAAFTLRNTILAGNVDLTDPTPSAGTDCLGALTSEGYNLFGVPCTIGGVTTGNVVDPEPDLALLAANGGETLTHALLGGSPALNAGYPGSGPGQPCEATDQRGVARGGAAGLCDIGAFEAVPPPPTPSVNPPPTTPPTPSATQKKKKCKKGRKAKKVKGKIRCVKKKKKRRK